MSAPVDDFDIDIRLDTVEALPLGEQAVLSQVQTNCNSACLTNCRASDCVCNQ